MGKSKAKAHRLNPDPNLRVRRRDKDCGKKMVRVSGAMPRRIKQGSMKAGKYGNREVWKLVSEKGKGVVWVGVCVKNRSWK